MKSISMFNASNDTNQWAVCVDGKFGLFATAAEAKAVYASITSIEESAFGSAEILAPHTVATQIGACMVGAPLSIYRAIDIARYVKMHQLRADRNYRPVRLSPAQRLLARRQFESLFA